MIHIYSYYNHGGFKDLYLGTLEECVESKYFIPLYKVYEQRMAANPNDTKSADKIALWSSLIQIKELNDSSPEAYPLDASVVISHSGYKVILKQLQNHSTLLSIRDIPGHADEFNRPCPFTIMLIGDNALDYKPLCTLAGYLKQKENLVLFETFCSGLFEYDTKMNALQFHFQEFVSKIKEIFSNHEIEEEQFNSDRRVKLFVVPKTLRPIDAIKEQGLAKSDIELLCDINGLKYVIPDDDAPRHHMAHSSIPQAKEWNREKDIWAYIHSLEVIIQKHEARIRTLENSNNTNDKI